VLRAANALLDAGRMPQGHLPFASGPLLAGALAAGAATDHESWFAEQVAEKLRAGLYVFLRKASCVDNIADGLKAVTEMRLPPRRLGLCADDVDCTDLVELGHMDHYVRYAIELGIEPLQAIQMATLIPAEAFRVDHLVGSLTPGRVADVLLVDDLRAFAIRQVFANGQPVAEGGRLRIALEPPAYPASFSGTMKLDRPLAEDDLYLRAPETAAKAVVLVMQVEPSQLRARREAVLAVHEGRIQPDPEEDALYISVTDRHSGRGKTATAFVGGFGLREGAFATSLSPDDDNVICIGASVPDMAVAIRHLFAIDGGQAVVHDGQVIADLALPVCGIMADLPAREMAEKERRLDEALARLGVTQPKPFFSILFLSITAIPEFAVTDLGLVETASRQVIDPVLSWE
jgi:adenine deaminase